MPAIVLVGAQWGDEGKGKATDLLGDRVHYVVRYQGGNNAGHTVVVGDQSYALHMLPSGVISPEVTPVIGNGVVIDPEVLLDEIDTLQARGVSCDKLLVSANAHLIMPYHRALDKVTERFLGSNRIGTTGRGIGPAYEDKVGRRAVRVCDLADKQALEDRVDDLLLHHNALLRGLDAPEFDRTELLARLREIAPQVLPYAAPVWRLLAESRRAGRRILFEGAQAAMLDVDHGTYPYVTSSNTLAGQVAAGSGIAPAAIGFVLGITKSYTTRVGSGPFPTELTDAIGRKLGERGREFGTVTGRPRRCGWFDAVMVRQAITLGGIDGIALTKLDVLDGFDEIKVCTGYRCGNKTYDYLPAGTTAQAEIQPVYEKLAGWRESTRGARSWVDLPANAIKYIRRVEELIGAPVTMLSTSPEREDTVLVRDPFVD